ncbi:VSG-associated, congolense-specific ORF [Trypanosoma congolense IL3000]|uniref:VSG-associated, congolense-specific ORF n=1 Tax=Trypanosoma congolense (strain IL3000) TaxID=1068625 RepID=F9WHG6_TRYCI|nr:VSG-associated, congolense-specific ORF [Trypanosoma congolense IL3000]
MPPLYTILSFLLLIPFLSPSPIGISMSNSPSSPSPEGMAQDNTPWSMEKDVVEVLLKNLGDPEKINLYRFLQPAYPFMHSYVSRFSITDFARNPWRCVGEADGREKVWQEFPRLLWQFRVLALKLVYYAGPPEGWGPREWEVWREFLKLDETDHDIMEGMVWAVCKMPPQPRGFLEAPYPIGYTGPIPMPHPPEPGTSL